MPISKETIALINIFKEPILELLTDVKDEVKFYFDTGILEYVETIREKFIRTKTFLYRLENIPFYDIYFPIPLNNAKNKSLEVVDVNNLFTASNFTSIVGNAGSGKSILMKHIFLSSIQQAIKIPIFLELRNLNDIQDTFFEYVNKQLSSKKLTPNKKILDRILSNGGFIFLLDGYDEIYSENKNKITAELIDFVDNYSKNYFLITSRPGANVESLPRFNSFKVNNLNNDQIEEFIQLQLKQHNDKRLADKIVMAINKPENKDYQSFLSNPLLLSMFIMTFNSYPELPKSKSKFYWNVFDTLSTKHDTYTKHGGYQHERKTGLQNEDFENILKWFSYISLFKGRYSFDNQYLAETLKTIKSKLGLVCNISDLISDLTVAISIIIIDGLEYRFPHKSLQEYFAALLIKEQSNEVKETLYPRKLIELSHNMFGGANDSFWNLCLELDEIAMKQYFIKSAFEDFLQNINFSSDENRLKSFIQLFNLKQGITKTQLLNKYRMTSFNWTPNIVLDILRYYNIFDLRDIMMYEPSRKLNNTIEILIKNNTITKNKDSRKKGDEEYILNYNNWNLHIISFLKETKSDKKIFKALDYIAKAIQKIEKEIQLHKKNNAALKELL